MCVSCSYSQLFDCSICTQHVLHLHWHQIEWFIFSQLLRSECSKTQSKWEKPPTLHVIWLRTSTLCVYTKENENENIWCRITYKQKTSENQWIGISARSFLILSSNLHCILTNFISCWRNYYTEHLQKVEIFPHSRTSKFTVFVLFFCCSGCHFPFSLFLFVCIFVFEWVREYAFYFYHRWCWLVVRVFSFWWSHLFCFPYSTYVHICMCQQSFQLKFLSGICRYTIRIYRMECVVALEAYAFVALSSAYFLHPHWLYKNCLGFSSTKNTLIHEFSHSYAWQPRASESN